VRTLVRKGLVTYEDSLHMQSRPLLLAVCCFINSVSSPYI
jgi:hypothetical protein